MDLSPSGLDEDTVMKSSYGQFADTICSTRAMVRLLVAALTLCLFLGVALADKFAWQKPPGPIAGSWQATCPGSKGMVIQFSVNGTVKATGTVTEVGSASKYGYTKGEEIFRLSADDFGKWVGQLKWRNVVGTERWDPITFVATDSVLNAIMTTDHCYKQMPRAR
jgi:hypothetical protein